MPQMYAHVYGSDDDICYVTLLGGYDCRSSKKHVSANRDGVLEGFGREDVPRPDVVGHQVEK